MRIHKLDGLRGIFSLMVLFFHYPKPLLPAFIGENFFVRESYTFVDFFFVLSGFVIAYNYHGLSTRQAFWTYIKKRFIRLYPLMVYTTLLMFAFKVFFTLYLPQYVQNPESFYVSALKTLDGLLLTNSFPVLTSSEGINVPSWSISAEFVAYFSFGILAVLVTGARRNYAFLTLMLLSYALLLVLGKTIDTSGDYGFLRALLSFNVGFFVWHFSKSTLRLPNGLEFLFPLVLAALFYALHLQGEWSVEKQLIGLSCIPLFFGLSIFMFLKTDGLLSRWLSTRPLKFLGDISYSLYLNHWLIIILVPKAFFSALKLPQSTTNQLLVFMGTIAIALAYSYFTYLYVEKRVSRQLRKRFLKKTRE